MFRPYKQLPASRWIAISVHQKQSFELRLSSKRATLKAKHACIRSLCNIITLFWRSVIFEHVYQYQCKFVCWPQCCTVADPHIFADCAKRIGMRCSVSRSVLGLRACGLHAPALDAAACSRWRDVGLGLSSCSLQQLLSGYYDYWRLENMRKTL